MELELKLAILIEDKLDFKIRFEGVLNGAHYSASQITQKIVYVEQRNHIIAANIYWVINMCQTL